MLDLIPELLRKKESKQIRSDIQGIIVRHTENNKRQI